MELLLENFDKYSFPIQEHFLEALLPYLENGKQEKVMWAVEKVYFIIKTMDKNQFSGELKEKIVKALDSALAHCDDMAAHGKVVEMLISLLSQIVAMDESYKVNFLAHCEKEFGSDGNHELALIGFISIFPYYPIEKQVQICGIYLGSKAFKDKNTDELIEKITDEFKKLPAKIVSGAEEVDFSSEPRINFLEKFILGISLDKNAWEFYAKLSKRLKQVLSDSEKKYLAAENIRKIKIETENPGVTRNRFTFIYNLKNEHVFSDSDIVGVFTNLFSSELLEKVQVAADCFGIYYPDFSKIGRKERGLYKAIIEKTIERITDEDLKKKLLGISARL